MRTIKVVELMGRRGERAKVTRVQVETYTVWAKDENGKVLELSTGLSYDAAKAEADDLRAGNAKYGRKITFLPCGTHPRRMGW